MYRFVCIALFLMPTAATFMPQFPVSDTSSRSSKTYALSSDVQKWLRNDKKAAAWDPVKLWDEMVSAPVRRHVEYGTPTISLGRQQNTRSNPFDDLVSFMKDNIKEANTAFRQFMNDVTSQVNAKSPQALAQQGDWGAFVDEEGTGRIYYFNVVTGESRWNPPTADFPMVNEPPRLLVSEGYWAAYMDEKKKSVYYFNRKTGQTTWNRPYPSFPRVSVNSIAQTAQRPLAVRGDWSAYLDDKNNVYYFNDVTGESTWQPPAGFPNVQAENFVSAFRNWLGVEKMDAPKWLEDVLEKIPFTPVSANQEKDMEWLTELTSRIDQQFEKATSSIRESWSFLDYFGRSKTFSANEFPIAAIVIDYMDELLASARNYFPFPDASRNIRQYTAMQAPTIHPDLEHLTRWKRNSDGTITGSVRHSTKHPVGTVITTSPAERGSAVAQQKVIRTLSGTRYYLL
ncbi:hypothetical protein FisN_5Hh401 [Fistulifera solaris]|uniref:WW domain-containing protein n=1 Tax=Fistulifera solaris TaxID=1519565 RepID=A0A1Z5JSM1_FISSO|nr:hypothetical protein FisN_5Hh401 [Fistulifera solaris]|eukprot:GAX17017.1 hypothetical protein FisN_5Hh401 [Fistulifera solaris]